MHSIGKPHPACESFDLTPEASTASRFATNLRPRYACLISFLSLMLVLYCSSLLLMWNTYTAGTQQNSGFMIQLELDSGISALSYYLVKSVYTYTETFRSLFFFFCQHRKTVTWPKARTSLITTAPPWDHFLCKIVSKLRRNRLHFFKLLDLSHLTDCVLKIWVITYRNDKKKKRSALINKSSGGNLKLLRYMGNMWIVVYVDDGS